MRKRRGNQGKDNHLRNMQSLRLPIFSLVEYLGASYWFLPALLAVLAFLLGLGSLALDRALQGSPILSNFWLYPGGVEGGQAVLSAITTSIIGIAGVVFSITIVTLVLAANQFGPRLLRNFMRDKANQGALGIFVATFIYSLIVLRTVYGAKTAEGSQFVPHISISVAVVLSFLSTGVLIFFIHHVAESIQAPNVIAAVDRDLHHVIDVFFPERLGRQYEPAPASPQNPEQELQRALTRPFSTITSNKSGYVQHIDSDLILDLARDHDLLVLVKYQPGNFLLNGDVVMQVWSEHEIDDELIALLRKTYNLGTQRTLAQDVLFGVNQLVEVAVRALSPGINDPFTAMQCLDRLGGALVHLAQREIPSPYRSDDQGRLRVVVYPVTFRLFSDAALNMIRHNSKNNIPVLSRILETIQHVLFHARRPEDRAILLEHANLAYQQAIEQVAIDHDRIALEALWRAVQSAQPASED